MRVLVGLAFYWCSLIQLPGQDPAAVPGIAGQADGAQRDARMAWWREARFGMFIHFGLYSQLAGRWKDAEAPGYSEWIQNRAAIPCADYAQVATSFNPTAFDADAIAALAKQAGMRYVIVTAKHHDGFALFASAASDFTSAKASPSHRDLVRELSTACAKAGLKFGVYYSQAQDWHHQGGAGNTWDAAQRGDFDQYLRRIAVPQVNELLRNYGPIAVLWYDTPRFMTDERAAPFMAAQRLQPALITNNRLMAFDGEHGSRTGDTETPEQFIPANGYPGKDWETCMTMNESWGYRASDANWKSSTTLLRTLSDIASKGGNFLLNIGPAGDGSVPSASVERLRDIGAWMQRNGEAITGTTTCPYQHKLTWGRITGRARAQGGTTLYLHCWQIPSDGWLALPGLDQQPLAARWLGHTETITCRVESSEGTPTLRVAAPRTAEVMPVIALDFAAPVSVPAHLPGPGADGSIVLNPEDVDLSGPDDAKPVVRGDGAKAVITNLQKGWHIQGSFNVPSAGPWSVQVEIACSAYSRITVGLLGPHGLSCTSATGANGRDLDDLRPVELGILRLPAGVQGLDIHTEMPDTRPVQIRRIILTPIISTK